MSPELKSILDEHDLLTGQEFLDLTDNNMKLYNEYIKFWDKVIMPDLVAKIKTQGTVEDARLLEAHSRVDNA